MTRKRVIVVTGASSGVGRAIVRAFAEGQARIARIARGQEGLEAAASEIEGRRRRSLGNSP